MRQANNHRGDRTAFTLVEILIVVGIIAALITVVAVVATKARGSANKFQLAAQLQTIAVGIEAYKSDFNGQLPPSASSFPTGTAPTPPTLPSPADIHINREGLRGARLLCKMLMGASGGQAGIVVYPGNYALSQGNQDGKVGLGFTTTGRTGVATLADSTGNMVGKSYGPYLAADKFKIANTATDADVANGIRVGDILPGATYDDRAVLLDANGSPILYFASMNQQAAAKLPFAYLSAGRADGIRDTGTLEVKAASVAEPNYLGTPAYVGLDNSAWLPTHVLRYLLGDTDLSGRFEDTEKPAVRNQYILWTAGPDGKFGPRNQDGTSAGIRLPLPNAMTTAERVAELKAAVNGNRYDDVTNIPE